MYIAFKWLIGLNLVMWLAMCISDVYLKNNKVFLAKKGNPFELPYRNSSIPTPKEPIAPIERSKQYHSLQYDNTALHYIMFFAGAIAVSVFNKKNEIMSYTKSQLAKIDIKTIIKEFKASWKRGCTKIAYSLKKWCVIFWENLRLCMFRLKNKRQRLKTETLESNRLSNSLLLKKIKEYVEERKRLGQLLIATVHENRNIRTQYRFEAMAKNRLVKLIEDTQKKVKENRSRYVNFQHLYLVTHQENMFLKARVRKLTKDKEKVENELMAIINEVYKSKHNELKTFCSRFIVRTRDNVLDADMSMEVRKFLERSREPRSHSDGDNNDAKDLPPAYTVEVAGSYADVSAMHLVSDAPRLKGLPGEYIWTIKDKNGIIEKLYEYDFESDLDNGDTIRRIREYSVYHDKDCLLDYSRSKNVDAENRKPAKLHLYPATGRFLTGSDAFQKFLHNNTNILPSTRSDTPTRNKRSLLCI